MRVESMRARQVPRRGQQVYVPLRTRLHRRQLRDRYVAIIVVPDTKLGFNAFAFALKEINTEIRNHRFSSNTAFLSSNLIRFIQTTFILHNIVLLY